MSSVRAGQPGATRLCPHCKATVLESATVCPGCRHHLRFNGGKQLAVEAYTSFSVDGSIAHRQQDEPCEYCIVLQVTNERGEQILRQVVGVGALQAGEQRRLNVTVDMLPLVAAVQPRPAAAAGSTLAAAPAAAAASAASASAAARESARPALGPRARAPGAPPARPAQPAAPASTAAPPAAAAPSPAPASEQGTTKSAAKSSGTPDPGATLGQRLRIFRKP